LVDAVVAERWTPNAVLAIGSPSHPSDEVALLRDRPQVDGVATAYVCRRFVCLRPVTDPADLAAALASP
jgi:uncharacterized protein YyaL (SSP411 family)